MNQEQTLSLEVSYSENQIKIGIQQPDDMVWHYDTLSVVISELDDCVRALTENINQMVRTEGETARAQEKIKILGQRLCDALLSPDIKNFLKKSTAEYLLLKLDDALVSLPWELICIDNTFLCELFCMGRTIKTHQSVAQITSRKITLPLNMWILSENDSHLSGVDKETQALISELDQINKAEKLVNAALDQGVSVDEIKSHIRDFDVVHYAGHADYNPSFCEKSGWRIGDAHFTAKDIDRMTNSGAMPALIFSNACQSARTQQWSFQNTETDDSFDLANAFMRSGVRHYLGTFWEIPDHAGKVFALPFYQALFSGKSIGQAMKQARKQCMETDGTSIGAAYVLYGDPTQTYFSENTERNPIQTRGSGFHPLRSISQKIKAMPSNALWLCLCIVLLFSGLWIGQNVIDLMFLNQQMDIQTTLKKRAQEKQAYIDRLFNEIEQLTGQKARPIISDSQNEWTSGRLSLSIDYETLPIQADQAKMSLIAAVIAKELIDQKKAVVLERVNLDKILQELKHANSGLLAKNERIVPALMSARLILFIELHREKNKTIALMHLADIKQGHVVDYFFYTLKDTTILKQKEWLARPLIKSLGRHYPMNQIPTSK
ncbi:CHAT domain protein [Candidatus Magnetomorum sp. HK-1]|nr:CHAT domain protein [Candidatus Magnetomorum sp. HK-1]